jgi:hypothetical protein
VLYIQSHTIEYSSIQLGGCVGENWYKQTTVEGVGYFVRDRVIINYVRYVDIYTTYVFRGELEGDPRSRSEDGLSKRARNLSS